MKIVGITGGVGCGKSQVLSILKNICSCKIVQADIIANYLKKPGGYCYKAIVELLGNDILMENGDIDNTKMASVIFEDKEKLTQVNAIIHPAVKEYILRDIQSDKTFDYYFLEAALLIESGFTSILDELWYIYAPGEVARKRLKSTRGYSDKKIDSIMSSQLCEAEFRAAADIVIDNGKDLDYTTEQLKKILDNKEGVMDFQEPDEEMFVEIELEDGTIKKCEVLTVLTVNEKDYIVLMPESDNTEEDDEGEVWFYGLKEDEDDPDAEPELIYIESDEEYEAVADAFDQYLDDIEFEELE